MKKYFMIFNTMGILFISGVFFPFVGWSQSAEHSTLTDDKTTLLGDVSFEMVYVEGGTFTMGCTSEQSDCDDDESPTHQVTLSSFYIGKYEITQAQWKAVMDTNPSCFIGDNLPIERVSWNDVQDFIRKLNAQTGKRYRLPTEAEWEFAARGGNKSRGYKYSGSNSLGNVAWYGDNSGVKTHPVGQKSPNELSIYDMSGNVWEWCSDWGADYSNVSQTNPTGPLFGSSHVLRGGGCSYRACRCRVSDRGSAPDHGISRDGGFRLVLEISPSYNNSDNNSSQTDRDMKVVSDDENTYTLSIPTNYVITDVVPNADFAYLNDKNGSGIVGMKESVKYIENVLGKTSLQDYSNIITNNLKDNNHTYHLFVDSENRTINGLNVLYYEYSIIVEGGLEFYYMTIFYKSETYFYYIFCQSLSSQKDELRDLNTSILNSFKISE